MIQKATFSLAKAIHHVACAKFYFELTVTESKAARESKQYLNSLSGRCNFILTDVASRIKTPEMRDALRQDLADPLLLDTFNDAILLLTPENREKVGDLINRLIENQDGNS